MSSIRPLITITILVVVGAYLYVKINEGAVRPAPGESAPWNQPTDGVPPLALGTATPTTSDSAAPPWPSTTATPAPTDTSTQPFPATSPAGAPPAQASVTEAASPLPAIPAIPEMPEIAATTQTDTAATPQVPSTPALPDNIPQARYPDQIATPEPGAQVDASIGAASPVSVPLATNVAPPSTEPIAPPVASTQDAATTPEQMNAATEAASGLSSSNLALQSNPLRPSPESTPEDSRYGASAPATDPASATAAPPAGSTFAEGWPTIQSALNRGELADAHKMLTRWYGDPSLTPTDAERVDTLLSQLAGSVVYSKEHTLAPARVVQQGETLETIAKEYSVPWQLLAKINGVSAPDQVRPGQELKVVRGPFNAVVDSGSNQLTLVVDGRYAGKFPVSFAPGQAISDGRWVVAQKQLLADRGVVAIPGEGGARAIVLRGEAADAAAATASPTITISDAPLAGSAGASIQVSAKDAEELSDILSIGSRVVTRR